MMELAVEREIYVTNIFTEASTLQGEKFCKILGLKRLLNTQIEKIPLQKKRQRIYT